jgi:hypothetical protein
LQALQDKFFCNGVCIRWKATRISHLLVTSWRTRHRSAWLNLVSSDNRVLLPYMCRRSLLYTQSNISFVYPQPWQQKYRVNTRQLSRSFITAHNKL